MKDQCLIFSDQTKKIKSKCMIFSGVSLFVGLTETLPKKFFLVGLDLSENEEVLGWFIFYITLILFLNFIVVTTIEIRGYYLPLLINHKTAKTTSDVLGLTSDECFQYQEESYNYEQEQEQDLEIGTASYEFESIDKKNRLISDNSIKEHVNIHNVAVFLFEIISPVIFSFIGMYYLYSYLSYLK